MLLRRGRVFRARPEPFVVVRAAGERHHVHRRGRHRGLHVGARARPRLRLARGRLRLRVVPEDAEGADQVATELAVEIAVLRPTLPSEAFEGRPHQVPDEVPEPLASRSLDEAVTPGEPGDDRLPDRGIGLLREARDEVDERRGRRIPGNHRRPRVVDQTLPFRGREIRGGARGQPGPQLVVVEDPNESRSARVPDHHGILGHQRDLEPLPLDEDAVDLFATGPDLPDDQRHRPGGGIIRM